MIRLYFKIPENFMGPTLLKEIWFVHAPFGFMDKFESLAQFPVDHLSNSVVTSLVFFLF